jgi:hypothetical protein
MNCVMQVGQSGEAREILRADASLPNFQIRRIAVMRLGSVKDIKNINDTEF